jgi:hypothetical protein
MSNFTLPTQRAKRLADKIAKERGLSQEDRDIVFMQVLGELNGEIADVASAVRDRAISYGRSKNIVALGVIDEFLNFLTAQLGTIEGKKVKPKKEKANTKTD